MIRRIAAQGLAPQLRSNGKGINLALLPPSPLITCRMIFTVVDGAQGHGKFITHFECDSLRLSVANVMCVGGGAAADQAWVAGYEAQVLF